MRRLILGAGLLCTVCVLAGLNENVLRQQLVSRFGANRLPLLNDWLAVIASANQQDDATRLKLINDFVNQRIVFADDRTVWLQEDYWATHLETLGQGRGDCEDFAILKYVSLRQTGIPDAMLRLVYVKATLNTVLGATAGAHMVLAYYATPSAQPLVLDNLDPTIRPAAQRVDLQPIFSFNGAGVFAGVSGDAQVAAGGPGRLSRWENTLRRLHADGFE